MKTLLIQTGRVIRYLLLFPVHLMHPELKGTSIPRRLVWYVQGIFHAHKSPDQLKAETDELKTQLDDATRERAELLRKLSRMS